MQAAMRMSLTSKPTVVKNTWVKVRVASLNCELRWRTQGTGCCAHKSNCQWYYLPIIEITIKFVNSQNLWFQFVLW